MYVKAGLISCILLTVCYLSMMHPVSWLNRGCKCRPSHRTEAVDSLLCFVQERAAFMIVPTFWVGTLNNLYFCYLQNKFHGHIRGKLWPGHESKSEVVRYSQPVPGRSEWDAPAAPLSLPWSSHTAGSPAPSPLWLVAHKLSWERRE